MEFLLDFMRDAKEMLFKLKSQGESARTFGERIFLEEERAGVHVIRQE